MKREFVETKVFSDDWKALGQSDDDLRAPQSFLAEHPDGEPMIEGTGGARKIRWGRSGRPAGKSGGVRVLCLDDARDTKDNLSSDERKAIKAFNKIIKGLEEVNAVLACVLGGASLALQGP